MNRLPEGVADSDDVVARIVAAGALAHRPVLAVTACGQPLWAMHRVAAGHMARMSCRWCRACFVRADSDGASGWARMLSLAYVPLFRTADLNSGPKFGPLNVSRTRPGVGSPSEGIR